MWALQRRLSQLAVGEESGKKTQLVMVYGYCKKIIKTVYSERLYVSILFDNTNGLCSCFDEYISIPKNIVRRLNLR